MAHVALLVFTACILHYGQGSPKHSALGAAVATCQGHLKDTVAVRRRGHLVTICSVSFSLSTQSLPHSRHVCVSIHGLCCSRHTMSLEWQWRVAGGLGALYALSPGDIAGPPSQTAAGVSTAGASDVKEGAHPWFLADAMLLLFCPLCLLPCHVPYTGPPIRKPNHSHHRRREELVAGRYKYLHHLLQPP